MRFVKGSSGNPLGRPKGTSYSARQRESADLILDMLPRIHDAVLQKAEYLLFVGFEGCAVGGWFDCKGVYASVAEAEAEGMDILKRSSGLGWFHIVDIESGEIALKHANEWATDDYFEDYE